MKKREPLDFYIITFLGIERHIFSAYERKRAYAVLKTIRENAAGWKRQWKLIHVREVIE